MKKILNISLLLVLGVIIAACSNKTAMYHPTNDDVSFEAGEFGALATDDETPFTFKLQRGVAKQELSVPLTFTSYTKEKDAEGNEVKVPNNVFNLITPSVTFAAGEYTKTFSVGYSYAAMEPGVDYFFEVHFNNEVAGPAGYSDLVGTVKMKLNYVDYLISGSYYYASKIGGWGIGKRIMDCLTANDVTLQRAAGTDNYYRLRGWKDPQNSGDPDKDLFALEFQYDSDNQIVIVATYPGYNDKASIVNFSGYKCVYYTLTYAGDTWKAYVLYDYMGFDPEIPVGSQIGIGDELDLYGWYNKNGSYFNNGYTAYDIYIFEGLE